MFLTILGKITNAGLQTGICSEEKKNTTQLQIKTREENWKDLTKTHEVIITPQHTKHDNSN